MPFNHFILCCLLLLLPSIFPSIRVFSNENIWNIWKFFENIWKFFASGGQSIKFLKVLKLCLNFIFCLLLMFLIPSFCPWTCYTHCVAAAAAAKSHQSCLTLCDPRRQPTRLPCPWDSPGKNTGVSCHFLLQLINIYRTLYTKKSEYTFFPNAHETFV